MVLHKTIWKGLVAAVCGALILAGCAQATSDTKKADVVDPFGAGTATLDGWTTGPGYGNTFDASAFRLIYVTNGTGRALALQYGASAAYGLADLYKDPLTLGNVAGYDQLLFDVKTNGPVNFGAVLRGSDAENGSSQIWQAAGADQYQGGTSGVYVTHTLKLADFTSQTGWGANSTFATAKAFLDDTANNAVWSQLNFLVTQNPGASGTDDIGVKLNLSIDNVRLHDSTGSIATDKVLFDFE